MSKVVFITGASSGLGKATAEFLASKGYVVYGTIRNPSGEQLPYKVIKMDVTDEPSVTAAVNRIIDAEGKIDAVINNAGMHTAGAIESFTDQEVNLQMDTNFTGFVRVTRAVLPFMRAQGGGKIINISSIGGMIGLPFQGLYSAAKFAIEGYSEVLAMEVKPWNIKVVVINPGDFKTGVTANRIITKKDTEGSDYRQRVKMAVAIMGKDEQSGYDPLVMAKTIEKIIRKKNPGYRFIVGRFDQRLIARIRHLLPPRLVRWIMADHYKVG